jgi:hypothetical protein
MAALDKKIESPTEQRELFLWKYADISRLEINDLLKVSRSHERNEQSTTKILGALPHAVSNKYTQEKMLLRGIC